jgi:hypothetical protein
MSTARLGLGASQITNAARTNATPTMDMMWLVASMTLCQRVLRHQLSGLPRQGAQHGKCLGRKRDRLSAASQAGIGLVQLEGVEAQPQGFPVTHG